MNMCFHRTEETAAEKYSLRGFGQHFVTTFCKLASYLLCCQACWGRGQWLGLAGSYTHHALGSPLLSLLG